MLRFRNKLSSCSAAIIRDLHRLRADRRGTVAIMAGLLMVPLVGSMAVGFEVSYWYMTKRAMQNAADAAVIAAATNGTSNYATEAKAVAAQYGFTDGSNNVTVTASNSASCPGGGSTCYSVTITDTVPLYLSQVVGFKGDTTLNSAAAKSLTSTAVATQGTVSVSLCLLALASSGTNPGILGNGSPHADLTGCNVMSNTGATCHGHNLNATDGLAHGTDNNCGITEYSNVPTVSDPYSGLASNIPTNTCASYPQEPTSKKAPALPASNQLSGSYSWSDNVMMCGDVQLTGNVTINASGSGAVLVIENGQLDSNGYTFQTAAGSGLTVVFSGTAGSYTHAPTGGGTFDIAAPTSGTWSGVAMYQDPSLTSGVDVTYAGNSPTWDMTGLVYMPHASVTFKGAVNKSSNGQSCFVLVVDNITIDGTGDILSRGSCGAAGLSMPAASVPARGQLVL
ncbi:MAG TPA: pilus assembly protein TadG-related protein [Xanthobacteraceae bacterium]|jgi:Flp pilus assembly protein TadG